MSGKHSGRVLVVDDDEDLVQLLDLGLTQQGFEVLVSASAAAAYDEIGRSEFDVILTDLNMPGMNGLEFCERMGANRPDIPADDFITKPIQVEALSLRLNKAIRSRSLENEVKRLREAAADGEGFGDLVGDSLAMKKVCDLMGRVADSDASVLITGESGTGKEVVARSLHERGRRSAGPFVAINCSALPEPLLESELFGHAKGAFTDARQDRAGLFLQADGGTLFLDEIGDTPIGLQPKLLRALQERMVRPVGGDREVAIDVRVIAATNRDLESAVADKRFREDLYFRINVIHVALPPLRARGRDVLLLAQSFLAKFSAREAKSVTQFSAATADKLLSYSWPGNVRELQNCVERAVALARYEEITVDDLPERIRDYKRSHVIVAGDDPSELVSMEQVEGRYIVRVMESVNGNKTSAAKVLGFDRKTLYRKLKRYGIEIESKDETTT